MCPEITFWFDLLVYCTMKGKEICVPVAFKNSCALGHLMCLHTVCKYPFHITKPHQNMSVPKCTCTMCWDLCFCSVYISCHVRVQKLMSNLILTIYNPLLLLQSMVKLWSEGFETKENLDQTHKITTAPPKNIPCSLLKRQCKEIIWLNFHKNQVKNKLCTGCMEIVG